MIEPRRNLDLGEEALGSEDGAELWAEHLERHLTIELFVHGEVDDGHAARADLALDDIAVTERGADIWSVGHASKVEIFTRTRQGKNSRRPRVAKLLALVPARYMDWGMVGDGQHP